MDRWADESECDLLTNCVVCKCQSMTGVLNLGMQPLANTYADTAQDAYDLTRYPLQVKQCFRCGHCQLSHRVNPTLLFQDYSYVSGTSKTMRDYMDGFADWALKDLDLTQRSNIAVLDIACNDGTLMRSFLDKGCSFVYGIDPAQNLVDLAKSQKLNAIQGYWPSSDTVDRFRSYGPMRYHIITALNVVAHVDNPVRFLKAAASILAEDGKIIIQTSQANWLKNKEFDCVYHEHISYFTYSSIAQLAIEADLFLESLEIVPIHGGSFRAVLRRKPPALDEEMVKTQDFLLQAVSGLPEKQFLIGGYGAAAKGNTLLNSYPRDIINLADHLRFVVDDNPLKVGKYIPGTQTPIIDLPEMVERAQGRNLALVVFSWNYLREITDKLVIALDHYNRKEETVLIVPFPTPRIVTLSRADIDG